MTDTKQDTGGNDAILEVQNLSTYFFTPSGVVKAVDDVSFTLHRRDILAIVGESGSGKSVTALSLMKLVASPPGRYVGGHVRIGGKDVLAMSEKELVKLRGGQIAMIFQNPRAALNPSFITINQVKETIRWHNPGLAEAEVERQAVRRLKDVGISDAQHVGSSYPHQISSGMCQRLGLALALSSNPEVLIADEPTTNLDANVQAKILLMLEQLHASQNIPIILITHDFGVVKALSTRIIVMYAGKIQEEGTSEMILRKPQHPYTRALIDSVPKPNQELDKLYQIPGQPPDLSNLPAGCSFSNRCEKVMPICRTTAPQLAPTPSGSMARCHLYCTAEAKA